MTSVNLSDLKRLRAAMTQGEWVSRPEDAEDGEVYTDEPYKIIVRTGRAPVAANATGIVATHNAADVLIEIAEAALALRDSRCDCSTEFHDSTAADCPMGSAENRLAKLLAKITP